MAPFYYKESEPYGGDSWSKWDGRPMDVRTPKGDDTGVKIFSVPQDPEQVRVLVREKGAIYVRGERGTTVFPGEEAVLNRDGFDVVDGATGEIVARVIHSEKPI